MYIVDEGDTVVELDGLPLWDTGAPLPSIYCDEHRLLLAYFLNWKTPTGEDRGDVSIVVSIDGCYAHMFGPPNDEAFNGHPLYERGLKPYSFAKIENSSWIRGLERMNSVHPYHRPERFEELIHYVFAFHDSTFECVAREYSFEEYKKSPTDALLAALTKIDHPRRIRLQTPWFNR